MRLCFIPKAHRTRFWKCFRNIWKDWLSAKQTTTELGSHSLGLILHSKKLKEDSMKALVLVMLCLVSLPAVIVAQNDDLNYVYDPDDRPDPFVPYKPLAVDVPPGQISVSGSKLVGITESHG